MKILLDTNFLLTTAKQKIDFHSLANDLFDKEISWLIPSEVLQELKELASRKGEKVKDKKSASLALQLTKTLPHKTIKLKNKNVDKGIIQYLKIHKAILATLDKKLKGKTKSKILTIRGKKSLEII